MGFFIHHAGPDEALIKSSGREGMRIVVGRRILAIPILDRVDRMSLKLRSVAVETKNAMTKNGVTVNIMANCQVKFQGWISSDIVHESSSVESAPSFASRTDLVNYQAIRLAAQHFLKKTDAEIDDVIRNTISGHQRAVIASLTIEDVWRDRTSFGDKVLSSVSKVMNNMGLDIVAFTVAEVCDDNGYIDTIGVEHIEKAKRDAVEHSSHHRAAAKVTSAMEDANAHLKVNEQLKLKIESDRIHTLLDGEAHEQMQQKRAARDKAYEICSAERDTALFLAQQKAKAAETEAKIEVMKRQIELEKLIKERDIRVEAVANLFKAKADAEGMLATAAAEAQRVNLVGQAEAENIRRKGMAEVDVLRMHEAAKEELYVTFVSFFRSITLTTFQISYFIWLFFLSNIFFSTKTSCLEAQEMTIQQPLMNLKVEHDQDSCAQSCRHPVATSCRLPCITTH